MSVVVVALVALIIAYLFAGFAKMARCNSDPRQQKLIQLFLAAGRSGEIADQIQITNFLCQQGDWSLKEDRQRVAHALAAVERISDRAVSEKARDIGISIGRTINDGLWRGA
jgi:hypothetical protein